MIPTELAIFIVNKEKHNAIEVMIGAHIVATIHPTKGGCRYRVLLPGFDGARVTSTVNKARWCVLHRLSAWFECAGDSFTPIAKALAAQAEVEQREAA